MSLRRMVRKLAVLLLPLAVVAGGAVTAQAQSCGAGGCAAPAQGFSISAGCVKCPKTHCPPPLVHCTPKPPHIKFKCACPKPICNPCDLDPTGNYGYTPTCWRPWMAEPNYGHCPVPSPTQIVPHNNTGLVPPPPPVPMPSADMLPPPRLESRLPAPIPPLMPR